MGDSEDTLTYPEVTPVELPEGVEPEPEPSGDVDEAPYESDPVTDEPKPAAKKPNTHTHKGGKKK